MAKAFVVSDVHSYYNELMTALDNAGFDINNESHIFISLGDLLDRGPDTIKCLDFVNNLPENRKILIRGNHEDLMLEAIARGYFERHDIHNKTVNTACDLTGHDLSDGDSVILEDVKNNDKWNKYINSCVDYYETDKEIFVHGWIPIQFTPSGNSMEDYLRDYYNPTYIYDPDWRKADYEWIEARWYNGMQMWSKGIVEPGKTIYCGHWHTSWGHSKLHHKGVEWEDSFAAAGVEAGCLPPEANKMHTEPFVDKGIVAMDACTAVCGIVNCKVIGKFKKLG